MANYLPTQFSPPRIRSYVYRLPVFTRVVLFIIVACYTASIFSPSLEPWAALKPSETTLQTLYRLNTFPFFHRGFFHTLFNVLALVPLLERFEAENGTLVSIMLFIGPFSTFPGGMYTLIERFILRSDTAILGSSIWVFLLLCNEAMKLYRANPSFAIGPYAIPTWTTPLMLIFTITFLMPSTSLLGHLCGASIGYLWGLNYIKFLAPPEKIVRWIEGKLNLLGRVPHYVSVDQKTYGRYGVLPSMGSSREARAENGFAMGSLGPGQRLGSGP